MPPVDRAPAAVEGGVEPRLLAPRIAAPIGRPDAHADPDRTAHAATRAIEALRQHRALTAIVAAAFVSRLVIRATLGQADFLENSYSFYLVIADHFLHGRGLCLEPGLSCALRVPGYPLLIAAFLQTGTLYPGLAAAQAAMGAALCWVVWLIGRELFNERTGLVAAGLAALSPYAVVHDTALQETVVLNLLLAAAACALVRVRTRGGWRAGFLAGLMLALATLTAARIALAVPATLLWAGMASGPTWKASARMAAIIAVPILLLVGGWVARNWRVVGAPVLTTDAGRSLWVANNARTFSYFPMRSIDLSSDASFSSMSSDEKRSFDAVFPDEVARDRLLSQWGVASISAHPVQTLWNGIRKLAVAASGILTPARSRAIEVGSLLVYAPIHLMAAFGLWRSRRGWQTKALVATMFLPFAVTTALFWAHTSHTSSLDGLLFVYAASVVVGGSNTQRRQSSTSPERVSPARAATKRAFDIALSGVGLLLSVPVWGIAAAAIKLEDGGPVFYTQERVGQNGRIFRVFKFRSMVPDAEARVGALQASAHDPRITRVGRFMRATALDELPQLWNIFRGDMSFVGPRALRPGEIEVAGNGRHEALEDVPGFGERCRVQPGLTGVAQIYAPRDIPRRQKFRYDRLYIRTRGFWLDLRLILLSFWITFRGTWEVRGRKY